MAQRWKDDRNGAEAEGLLADIWSSSQTIDGSDASDVELDGLREPYSRNRSTSRSSTQWWRTAGLFGRRKPDHKSTATNRHILHPLAARSRRRRRRRSWLARVAQIISWAPCILIFIILVCGIFFPSYSHPPQRYTDLRDRVQTSNATGTANPNGEKIFIVASLYDQKGQLLSGHWGRSVRALVDMLGPANVFVSVYENDASHDSIEALQSFGASLPCNRSLVTDHMDMADLPPLTLANGTERVKRIAFLAEVRNRALGPLDDPMSPASRTRWDKLLYLNDVAFDPIDAANLLFNTNVDEASGRTDYRAACAVDFLDPWKLYDTYATRDLEGYPLGVPIYPWFSTSGDGQSRREVLQQTDAVRVKSCWGGMVAFEAKWFQSRLHQGDEAESSSSSPSHSSSNNSLAQPPPWGVKNDSSSPPLRFRFETEINWDASECCLINADLTDMAYGHASDEEQQLSDTTTTGVYMNPYVRVAYSPQVHSWLGFARRFERLFTPVQQLITALAGLPRANARRLQRAGDEVTHFVWRPKAAAEAEQEASSGPVIGPFEAVKLRATPGQFCGLHKLSYMREKPRDGGKNWVSQDAPGID